MLRLKSGLKTLLPIVALIVACFATAAMFVVRPTPEARVPELSRPVVEVAVARPETAAFSVRAQGVVAPRTESDLVTEVSGRILWISPRMASGGFFDAEEPLLRIDSRVYAAAVEGARAALARAESELALQAAKLERQESIARQGGTSRAALDAAHHAKVAAEAGAREAGAALERALYDLERCEIRAPYAGRVREKLADVGEFVSRGVDVARIYAVDYAEVRLPIADRDLAYLDLSMGFREESGTRAPRDQPRVSLSADFAGRRHTWSARVVRVEGALDPKTRMVNVVARVDDPYSRGDDPARPPLVAGLFVDARIAGREVEGLFRLPRGALRDQGRLAVVDEGGRLALREVEVAREEDDVVWVASGLAPGERVVTTPMAVVVEGTAVSALGAAPFAHASAGGSGPRP